MKLEIRDCPICGGPLTFLKISSSSRAFSFDENGELKEDETNEAEEWEGELFVQCQNDDSHNIEAGYQIKEFTLEEYDAWLDGVWDAIYEKFI